MGLPSEGREELRGGHGEVGPLLSTSDGYQSLLGVGWGETRGC